MSAAIQRKAGDCRAGTIDVETPGERARIPRLLQPVDVEPLSEAAEIDPVDRAVTGVAHGLLPRVDRADGAIAYGRAQEFRARERRAPRNERIGELARDVVIERQEALDVRHGNGRRQVPEIDSGRAPLKMKWKRPVDAERGVGGRHGRTVRRRAGLGDQHVGVGQPPARPHVVRRVVHVHRVRSLKPVHAPREVTPELKREIECHVSGDIRWPVIAIEPAGQVQSIDIDRARPVPAGHGRIQCQAPLDAAARPREIQVGHEPIDRTVERRGERGLHGDVFQAADHAGPLLKGEARRAHLKVQCRRLRPRVDRAVEHVA